ncbi:MAG: right-handed parallel beta-helix repeat-containing protein [Ignavibacteria bacterium]|nr:right-handed parallel beta-helix repeat-containing protein [Ignavibacteria bacterium]
MVIENLHVRNNNNGGAGIRVVSDSSPFFVTKDVIVRKCLVHDTYRQGILVQAKNVTIEGCEIYNAVLRNTNGILGQSGWEFALGTYLWPSDVDCWNNIVFRNNIVHNSWGEGIVALRCHNFLIENNHVYDCFSAYIYIDNSRKGIIRNNWVHSTNDTYNRWNTAHTFYAPGIGIQWAAEQNSYGVDSLVSDLDIYNNLIVRTNHPISWWRDISNTRFNNSYENINVYYNTMYLAYGYEGFHLDENISGVYTPTNCNFKNNIICKGQYPLGSYQRYISTSSHYQNWNIDYNCFMYGNIPVNIPVSNNIQGTPSFVDTTYIHIDTNFRIKSNSNCRFTASPINNIEYDYWNALRDDIEPCIGFHEYGGTLGTGSIESEILRSYYLGQNYPNPFNPTSIIHFELKRKIYCKFNYL